MCGGHDITVVLKGLSKVLNLSKYLYEVLKEEMGDENHFNITTKNYSFILAVNLSKPMHSSTCSTGNTTCHMRV